MLMIMMVMAMMMIHDGSDNKDFAKDYDDDDVDN